MIKLSEDKFLAYDIETTSNDSNPKNAVYPAYCKLKMVSYQLGLRSEPRVVDLKSKSECRELRSLLRNPDILKVSYNGINFDDIVLARYGFYVESRGQHDMFLGLKTVEPRLPSYSLKFVNWYYLNDHHEPQRVLKAWLMRHKKVSMGNAPADLLGEYCKHDVRQTVNVFRMIWEKLQKPKHWKVYNEMELAMAGPLHEMILTAGEWIDPFGTLNKIRELQKLRRKYRKKIIRLSNGLIVNPDSPKQVGICFRKLGIMKDAERNIFGFEDHGDISRYGAGLYSVVRSDLIALMAKYPIAKAVFELRDTNKLIQHMFCHYKASKYEYRKHRDQNSEDELLPLDYKISIAKNSHMQHSNNGSNFEAIPKGYSVSSARTRRFQSSSQFGINFQNQSKRTKVVQLVPNGWLGCWIDSRQIENIVHIWASKDSTRRAAYEADTDWNEYVWIANKVLGTKYTRKELEEMPSPMNPQWTMYKTYKTVKLALNFGMGEAKFAKTTGFDPRTAAQLFAQVHKACPAIRNIGTLIRDEMFANGHVTDPFGHIYSGYFGNAQMSIVHLVQGCGTGSVPKAMTVANYQTLHSLDSKEPRCWPCIYDRFRKVYSYGVIAGTTHDECAFRISLGLSARYIINLVRGCLYNMEERFSSLFDGIPLRAQLAVSVTNASDQEELNHHDPDFERRLCEYIHKGRR